MSIEQQLAENTAALKENTEALLKLLGQTNGAKATGAAKAEAKAEPKAEPKAETKTDEPAGLTFEQVKAKAAAWLAEHEKGSPEQAARRAYLENTLWPKLKIAKLGDLADKPAEFAKVNTWLDTKAKSDLLGYGAGIFAAPAGDGDATSEEEL